MEPRLTSDDLGHRALVEERLKSISAQLIAAHRHRDGAKVLAYARQAGLAAEGLAPQKLFQKTIQVFHPDRLNLLWARIEQARTSGDPAALEEFSRLLEDRGGVASARGPVFQEADPGEDEEYGFDPTDDAFFGEDGDEDWDSDSGTFYAAVKRVLFGNLDFYPDPADLARLEGELDLSDWELHDLEGIEHCRGISSLNLSRNNLDNVYPLKDLVKLEVLDLAENDLEDADWLGNLVHLRELDLSANEIDDVAFLSRLPLLRYVDLSGNPVRNRAVLAALEARGVIVIL